MMEKHQVAWLKNYVCEILDLKMGGNKVRYTDPPFSAGKVPTQYYWAWSGRGWYWPRADALLTCA